MKYEEPELFEIKIACFAQGGFDPNTGDPTPGGEGSGGLPDAPEGDDPWKN